MLMFKVHLLKSVSVSFSQGIVSLFICVFQVRVQHEIQVIVKFSKIDLIFRVFSVFVFFFSFTSFFRLRRITNYIFRIAFLTKQLHLRCCRIILLWPDDLALQYNKNPCFDVKNYTSLYKGQWSLLKQCKWKGRKLPCSAIFSTYPTDKGMCCAFNMRKAEEIFKSGKYVNLVQELQEKDKNTAFESSQEPRW